MDKAATTSRAMIDGIEVEVRPGETILQAARRAGTAIPTLCEDPRLGSSGACRLCVVKIDGRGGVVSACNHSLEPGVQVETRDAEIFELRKAILGLLVSESPADSCSACTADGPCQLHALAEEYGAVGVPYPVDTSDRVVQDPNPFILRDYSQCIYCYRCTLVCNELEAARAIVPSARGFKSRISTSGSDGLLSSPCTFCGQCVQVCPTGALTNRKSIQVEVGSPVEKVRTTCPYCGTGCGIELHVSDGKIVDVTPDWTTPANQGALCVKGQFGMDFVGHPDRLTTPLIRRNGSFEPAGWDEAYDLIVERFNEIKSESGPDAFAIWASGRAPSEGNYLLQKMGRAVIGTNNVDNCART